jgi:hypothetical protein
LSRRRIAAVLGAVVLVGAGLVLVRQQQSARAECAPSGAVRQAPPFEAFIDRACRATTVLLDAAPDRFRYRQTVPGSSTTVIQVRVLPDRQIDTTIARSATMVGGEVIYPLLAQRRTRGDLRYLTVAFFVPYSSLSPTTLERLGVRPRSQSIPSTRLAAVRSGPVSVPGMVIESITASSNTSGTGPGLDANTVFEGTDLNAGYDKNAGDTIAHEVEPELTIKVDPESRAWLESPYAQQYMKETNDVIKETGVHPEAELARGEAMAADVEAELARSSERATNRFGAALAGLQAIGEWMQQALDFFENDAALQAAEDCHNNPTNPTAQNARARDRANYDRALEQIREARADNNWDTGVRALNTANGAATAAIPGAPGLALGIASGGSNATLRQLQQQRTRQAVAGVTPCDPASVAGGSGGAGGTANTGRPAPTTAPSGSSPQPIAPPSNPPGPPLIITVAPTATPAPRTPNTAHITVDYDHVNQGFSHRIGFVALAVLSNKVEVKLNSNGQEVTLVQEFPDFYGNGVGYYSEFGTSNDTGCSVSRTGFVTMEVKAQMAIHEIDVHLVGELKRVGDASCVANVDDTTRPDVTCVFRDVDFEKGGHYVAQDYEGEANDQIWHERCYLELGPTKWSRSPSPGTTAHRPLSS